MDFRGTGREEWGKGDKEEGVKERVRRKGVWEKEKPGREGEKEVGMGIDSLNAHTPTSYVLAMPLYADTQPLLIQAR